MSAFIFFFVVVYTVSFEAFISHPIFKVDKGDIEKVVSWKAKRNTLIFDSNNQIISEQFNQFHEYIPFEKIPPNMINAITSVEDKNFFNHKGIDLYGIIRALVFHLKSSGKSYKQGASTITQQIVRNLLLHNKKTLTRKVREIILSLYLETKLSKEKIFEIYCNQMFLGNGSYGIGAASKRYFGKEIGELDIHESALIAGLFQLPSYYNPKKHPERAKKRQLKVLKSMSISGKISLNQLNEEASKTLEYKKYESFHGKRAPYFVDYAIEESKKILQELNLDIKDSGLKIYTTLDQSLQNLAEKSFSSSSHIFEFAKKNLKRTSRTDQGLGVEGGMLVMDHKTGEIKALIGGLDYKKSQYNRAVKAKRPPGSIFKSITYSYALNNGHMWNDLHYITPITVGNYRPKVHWEDRLTETTLLKAFYRSTNSTSVEIGIDFGVKRIIKYAEKLGIQTPLRSEASTLLGGSEVTMLDMGRVYSTFANKGTRVEQMVIKKITNDKGEILYEGQDIDNRSKRILSKRNNELIVEGLKNVIKRGTGYRARSVSRYSAGKTGTSNGSKDNWFAGFTNDLTVIVWLGNDDQVPFWGKVSSSNTAVPLWAKFVKNSIKYLNTMPLKKPQYLSKMRIDPEIGNIDKAGITMYFTPDKLPKNKNKADISFLAQGKKLRATME